MEYRASVSEFLMTPSVRALCVAKGDQDSETLFYFAAEPAKMTNEEKQQFKN